MMGWVVIGLGTALYVRGISGHWRTLGVLPKSLYGLGGLLLGIFVLWHTAVLFVLGVSALALSRIVPAKGWKKQPGEG